MSQLFDEKPRSYTKSALRAETTYSFLDRSALPELDKVRAMLQRWIERLPDEHQPRAVANLSHRGRGSSSDQFQFDAAFFELFLHEFLAGTGGRVTVEPNFDDLTPDFSVTQNLRDERQLTYVVEATDINLERGTELEHDWNEKSVFDWLDEIGSEDFCLWVKTHGKLVVTLRKRQLKKVFEDLLKTAQYHQTLITFQNPNSRLEDLPSASFVHDEWGVEGYLIPVSSENRGKSRPFVGVVSAGAAFINDIGKTKNRLYDKAKRYKNVGNIIIALRCDISNDRLSEALFGRQQFTFYVHKDPAATGTQPESHYNQRLDGFWCNSTGPQNQHVIGVVAFHGVYPNALDRAKVVFLTNPYVEQPMPDWTISVAHAEYSDGKINFVEGLPPSAFLRDYEVIDNSFS